MNGVGGGVDAKEAGISPPNGRMIIKILISISIIYSDIPRQLGLAAGGGGNWLPRVCDVCSPLQSSGVELICVENSARSVTRVKMFPRYDDFLKGDTIRQPSFVNTQLESCNLSKLYQCGVISVSYKLLE